MTRTRRTAGFTLLELLVALAIFAVLSVLAYGGVRHLLSFEDGLAQSTRRFDRLQFAVVLLEQDLRNAVPRTVRDALGEREPALRAGLRGELLTLTRRAPALGTAAAGPGLRRVRYRLEHGDLYRDVWEQLDRTPGTGFETRRLLRDVASLRLRFFGDGAWAEFWPPDDNVETQDALPRGVEFKLEFKNAEILRRVLARPG